jgi:hypothetical protein
MVLGRQQRIQVFLPLLKTPYDPYLLSKRAEEEHLFSFWVPEQQPHQADAVLDVTVGV